MGGCGRYKLLGALLFAGPANAQFNTETTGEWNSVRLVRYDVVGEYETPLLPETDGAVCQRGIVMTDRVEISFVLDHKAGMVVGTPSFRNFPAEFSRDEASASSDCASSPAHGRYDYASFSGFKQGRRDDRLGLFGMIHTDTGEVVDVSCSVCDYIALADDESQFWPDLPLPSPLLFGLPQGMAGNNVVVDHEAGTIIAQSGGWVFTYRISPAD